MWVLCYKLFNGFPLHSDAICEPTVLCMIWPPANASICSAPYESLLHCNCVGLLSIPSACHAFSCPRTLYVLSPASRMLFPRFSPSLLPQFIQASSQTLSSQRGLSWTLTRILHAVTSSYILPCFTYLYCLLGCIASWHNICLLSVSIPES